MANPRPVEREAQGGTVERPRAADDFEVIRERLEELRRQREEISSTETPASPQGDADDEQRRQEQCEGAPPSWVPTIFLPQPTD
jgi:uncharacterized protein involved in exopolysaccharide biosynthesis